MKKMFKTIIVSLALVAGAGLISLHPDAALAAPATDIQSGIDATKVGGTATDMTAVLKAVISVLLFIVGAISVVMIIIGGIKYTTSNGEAAQVTSAKNTILYAVVGVVVAFSAYAIVSWVTKSI